LSVTRDVYRGFSRDMVESGMIILGWADDRWRL